MSNLLEIIIKEPSIVNSFLKDELISVAKELEMEVSQATKKAIIKEEVIKELIERSLVDGSAFEIEDEEEDEDETKDKGEIENSKGNPKLSFHKMKMLELEKENELRMKGFELEKEKLRADAEEKLRADAEIKLKELEVKLAKSKEPILEKTMLHSDIAKNIRLVPAFNKDCVDKYFIHFEKIVEALKWPSEQRCLLLQSVLIGKAQEVYSAIPLQKSSDFEFVKQAILNAYQLIPEAYRQKFRNLEKSQEQTYVEFSKEKESLFDRWCQSTHVDKDYEKLKQLILIEEFKQCMPQDISTYLEEQKVSSLYKAAELADSYLLTHTKNFNQTTIKQRIVKENNMKPNEVQSIKENYSSEPKHGFPKYFKQIQCAYCKKIGHLISDCWTLKRKKTNSKPVANVIEISTDTESSDKERERNDTDCSTPEELKPFVFDGTVSLTNMGESQKIKILRDTGATQSLILQESLPFSEESSLHESVLISGVEGGIVQAPLHYINLQSDLISRGVSVGVRPTLPIKGISMLLGNDLAGCNVIPKPRMLEVPLTSKGNYHESSLLFPSCVVTRAQAKLQKNEDESLHLNELFGENKVQNDKEDQTATDAQTAKDTTDSTESTTFELNKRRLVTEQEKDTTLQSLYFRAVTENEAKDQARCYYIKDKVLMRKWRPPTVPADEEWNVKHQIVTPQRYRREVLQLAHDSPMAGHLGVRKTADRVLKHFFWPGIRKDITRYCKTCHTCQMVGKPNQNIPPAPLKPIPAFEEPFSKIIIDCVGPLPKSRWMPVHLNHHVRLNSFSRGNSTQKDNFTLHCKRADEIFHYLRSA